MFLFFWPNEKETPDLMLRSETAYDERINAREYEAEKGLLELYRTFVIEMLRISLVGVAVLGFLSELAKGSMPEVSKWFGAFSMAFFVVSSFFALAFLYSSANAYRAYIAGLRAKVAEDKSKHDSNYYLEMRHKMLKSVNWTKFLAAFFLVAGAFAAMIAISLTLFCGDSAIKAAQSDEDSDKAAECENQNSSFRPGNGSL